MPKSNSFDNSRKSKFDNRMEERFKDEKLNYYSSHYYSNLELTVIKVSLERAVLEYANSLKAYFDSEIKLNNYDFLIDMSKAIFLDSTYLGAIIYCFKLANSNGSNLGLILDVEKVKVLSHIDNLDSILKVYPSLEIAKEQIQKQS